jgi:hypothetical protein
VRIAILEDDGPVLCRASGMGEPRLLDRPPDQLAFERRVYLGVPAELTPEEFEVARLLFRQTGRLTSRGHLLEPAA